jgi:hypothetical protein
VLRRRQAADELGRGDRRLHHLIPPGIEARGAHDEVDRRHLDVLEPRRRQQLGDRLLGAQRERPRPVRHRRWREAPRHERLSQDLHPRVALEVVPHRQRHPPARLEHPPRLAQGRLWVEQQHVAEAADDAVDRRRREIDPLGLHAP